MYDKLTPKQEAANAYKYGVRDATEGRERKNASDFYGPYADDYLSGYQSVVNSHFPDQVDPRDEDHIYCNADPGETPGKNLDHLSAFFDFGGKR
jgi:hypothetical protein